MPDYHLKLPLHTCIAIECAVSFHYFEYTPSFEGVAESHDFWELVYVDYGELITVGGECRHLLHSGDVIFHEPGETHNVFANNSFSASVILSFSSASPDLSLFRGKHFSLSDSERRLLGEVFQQGTQLFEAPYDVMDQKRLINKADASYGAEQLFKSHLEQFLIHLIRGHFKQAHPAEPQPLMLQDSALTEQVISILSSHIYGRITLPEISREIAFSLSYLEKEFKRCTARSVMEYYNYMKIAEAKRLISHCQYSFTEIADKLEFGSIHYFSRLFKSCTGMSPTAYQKSVQRRALL